MTSALAIALLVATATPTPSVATEPEERSGFEWLVVPVLKFNDDIGLMYGIHTIFKEYGERGSSRAMDFDWFLELKARHSTKNRHEHWLYFDAPRLYGMQLRILGEFLRIDDANYFGIGNNKTIKTPGDQVYQYRLTEPRLQTFLSGVIDGAWRWGAGITFAYTDTKYEPTTVLAEEQPTGVDGGHLALGIAALVYDTRNDELRPTDGYYLQLYAKAATRPLGSKFSFQGIGFEAAGFYSPLPNFVYAARFMGEELGGDVPFYELARIGGLRSAFGVGGVFTQRGYSESRFIGKRKLMTNQELRYYFPKILDLVSFGIGVFGDASIVTDVDARIRPSGGFELSAKWKELITVRADMGFSNEEAVFYVEGRHMF